MGNNHFKRIPNIHRDPKPPNQKEPSPKDNDDLLLMVPSGLTMAKDKTTGTRGTRKYKKKPRIYTRRKMPRDIPPNGRLEFFGFRAICPKEGNLVQSSTLVAEVEKNDYSGTYVSTVP
jgi:hypothetical protein